MVVQDKEELWKAAVDSQLLLEVRCSLPWPLFLCHCIPSCLKESPVHK